MPRRRDMMVRLGQIGLGALTLPRLLQAEDRVLRTSSTESVLGTAKSCILLFLWGGPPQQDTWDMKPDAPEGIRSQFSPIETVVPGIQVSEPMPLIARKTDKLAVIRSITHDSNEHEPSVYHTLTGRKNPSLRVPRNQRSRNDFPSVGSGVARFSEPTGMPASVTLPCPVSHDGVTYAGTHAGFLGPAYDPMELAPGHGANHQRGLSESIALRAGVDATRMDARYGLLESIEQEQRLRDAGGGTGGLGSFREQAFRMISAPEAKQALDLQRETDVVRDRYGRNSYGESFLLARRLVESGVRLVTVTWLYVTPKGTVSNVWDNHGGTASLGGISGYEMLKADYCLPPLDRALSALLEDMHGTGLLDETLIVAMGEFGRTPKINAAGGRDHWGALQSIVMAGGGVQGGQVYGSSDRHAAYPRDQAHSPADVVATIYSALGISHDSEVRDREGRPLRLCEGAPIRGIFS